MIKTSASERHFIGRNRVVQRIDRKIVSVLSRETLSQKEKNSGILTGETGKFHQPRRVKFIIFTRLPSALMRCAPYFGSAGVLPNVSKYSK